ncbi:hypothetical protein JCM11491_006022 [Sporobolomyces phaffii]
MHDPVNVQRRMHKRARSSTSTTLEVAASTTATARGARGRTSSSTANTVATTGNTAFKPGAAASGTATRTVPNGPPTHSGISSIDDSFYSSWSFANQGSGLSLASAAPATTGSTGGSAAAGIGGSGKAGTTGDGMQLTQGALIGIIAGGAAAGVALLALIGWCCWKRKKSKKDEAGWWSLDDDPSKGAVKNVGQNQAAATGGRGQQQPSAASTATNEGRDPWQSTDSLGSGQYSGEKQSQQNWNNRFDEKRGQQHAALPSSASHQPRDLQAQRQELFAPPSATRTLTPSPSNSSLPQPPRAPFAQSARPDTGNYSVNDVISFTGGPRQNSQYPPVSSVYPASAIDYPRSAAATPPPSRPPPNRQVVDLPNKASVGHESYPPKRPPRPSEVPSAPPSPYNYVKDAERPTSRDQGIANRFMDIMTGRDDDGGDEDEAKEEIRARDEEVDGKKKKRQSVKPTSNGKSKKDTIMGLTDVYAGGGEEEWAQVEVEQTARRSTLARGSSKRSQRTIDSPTKAGFPPFPNNLTSLNQPPTSYPASHNSSRIDSKPLKELEGYFGSFAPPSRNARALSGVSETTNGETAYSYGTRASVASSDTPRPGFSRQQSYGTPTGGHAHVTASASQASLSPFAAPQGGRPGAYGEFTTNPISVYSAAGEVSEMSSGSSAGSPSKRRSAAGGGGGGFGASTSSVSLGSLSGPTTTTRTPLGGNGAPEVDVFGPSGSTHPLGASQPSPARATEQPAYPLSTAEQDILNQLGLATPSSSGERTPDLSLSSIHFDDSDHQSNGSLSSSVGLATPSTPQFPPTALASGQSGGTNSPSPLLEPKAPPRRGPPPSSLAVPTSPSELAKNGFVPLYEMSKHLDPQYRSATLSMYNLYD